MKKILAIFIAITILLITPIVSFAATTSKTTSTKITTSKTKDVKFTKSSSQDKVAIYTAIYKGYKVSYLPNPSRYIIDIPNNLLTITNKKAVKANGLYIKNIRFSQFTKNSVRIVLDVSGKLKYKVEEKKGILYLVVKKQDNTAVDRGDVDRTPTPSPSPVPDPVTTTDPVISPSPAPTQIPVPTTTPTPDPALTPTPAAPDTVTPALPSPTPAAPIVISGKNLEYINYNDSISFTIKGIKLDNGTADFKSQTNAYYDEASKNYTLFFPTSLVELNDGTIPVYDGAINDIKIVNDLLSQNTFIFFSANNHYTYTITNGQNYNEAVLTLTKRAVSPGTLVVLDAGHGGSDPGASYYNLLEKDINLKITLKVDEILRSYGVNTYLTRNDDSAISIYDRAKIANNLNATLYLSIHNNAFDSSEFGTETLYYPSSASKQFAQAVQDSLITTLNTKNRGIVSRPNLIVLNSTKMPAALAEVAFITNASDRAMLLDDAFIQRAAEALSEAVLKTLGVK